MNKPRVVIIGAGPAGLTAALELVRDGRMTVLVLEGSTEVGGISRTVQYKGNRMDIGGHRFFSKSDWVMNWWQELLPVSGNAAEVEIAYHGQRRRVGAAGTAAADSGLVMLVRDRLSRIYFLRKYFDYPIKLNGNTLRNLGLVRLVRIGFSYLRTMIFPRRPEVSLEDFLINRFGAELHRTFFKDYTEKVWGVSCDRISAEWGAQRIKGVSIIEALKHALTGGTKGKDDKATKTSLIEHFLYPRLGPGQLWEEAARRIRVGGGDIQFGCTVVGIRHQDGRVLAVRVLRDGVTEEIAGDHIISTMPVKDLVAGMEPPAPEAVRAIAAELPYRDFITVGLLVKRMKANEQALSAKQNQMPPDNWIYVQEPDVRIGRLQVFNNWSPDLVADPESIWLGLEYFCQEGDDLWSLPDPEIQRLAVEELERIGMIDGADVIDSTVIRVPKTYPAYFGAYEQFPRVREWLDSFGNLWLIGRNGMHRYNNQDHSMLTAKLAVEAILDGTVGKAKIWGVNIDDDYHEEQSSPP